MKNRPDKTILDAMSKDPRNWKGVLYFNRKDPRITVPKINPLLGWTFNFASPYPYILIICVIVIIIVTNYFL